MKCLTSVKQHYKISQESEGFRGHIEWIQTYALATEGFCQPFSKGIKWDITNVQGCTPVSSHTGEGFALCSLSSLAGCNAHDLHMDNTDQCISPDLGPKPEVSNSALAPSDFQYRQQIEKGVVPFWLMLNITKGLDYKIWWVNRGCLRCPIPAPLAAILHPGQKNTLEN